MVGKFAKEPEPVVIERWALIDAQNMAHRCMFNTPPIEHDGMPSNVIYGFFNSLLSLNDAYFMANPVFCWDSKKSFRKLVSNEYKANRGKDRTPEDEEKIQDMYRQINLLKREILPAMGFSNSYEQIGCEADDLIAQIAKDYHDPNSCRYMVIHSTDKDLLQCLTEQVSWRSLGGKEVINAHDFRKTYHLDPHHWATVKAIAGCSSDNLSGVSGVGEDSALKYLQGTLTSGARYDKIKQAEQDGTIESMLELVKLPHAKTRPIELKQDSFGMKKFCSVFKAWGMDDLYRQNFKKLESWSNPFL